MGLRQIQVTVPKDKGAEIFELLSILPGGSHFSNGIPSGSSGRS